MHGHNRLTDNNKTTNDREDEVVGIYICRSRSPYVVAEVVVVVIVVVEFILTVHAHLYWTQYGVNTGRGLDRVN